MQSEFVNYAGLARLIGPGPSGRPVHASTIRQWVRDGTLPQPVRLGTKVIRFNVAEVLAALDKSKRGRQPAG